MEKRKVLPGILKNVRFTQIRIRGSFHRNRMNFGCTQQDPWKRETFFHPLQIEENGFHLFRMDRDPAHQEGVIHATRNVEVSPFIDMTAIAGLEPGCPVVRLELSLGVQIPAQQMVPVNPDFTGLSSGQFHSRM